MREEDVKKDEKMRRRARERCEKKKIKKFLENSFFEKIYFITDASLVFTEYY